MGQERRDRDEPADRPPLRPEQVGGAAQRVAHVHIGCGDGAAVLVEERQVRAERRQHGAAEPHNNRRRKIRHFPQRILPGLAKVAAGAARRAGRAHQREQATRLPPATRTGSQRPPRRDAPPATPMDDEERSGVGITPCLLRSAIPKARGRATAPLATRPERQCAARRLVRRRRVLWWRSGRMRSRSPSAARLGSWGHRGQVQHLRARHQIELGPRQRGVSRA
jgi:hypothetical protein